METSPSRPVVMAIIGPYQRATTELATAARDTWFPLDCADSTCIRLPNVLESLSSLPTRWQYMERVEGEIPLLPEKVSTFDKIPTQVLVRSADGYSGM